MSTYLFLNLLIVLVPLILSFEGKVKYYSKFKCVFLSIVIAAVPYLLWDALATYRGDWSFNEKYLLGLKFINLPVEEVLFFITVPFSSFFIFESLGIYYKDKKIRVSNYIFIIFGFLFLIAALFIVNRYYTSAALAFTGLFFISAGIFFPYLLRSRLYWIFISIMYIPFLVFNYILTSLPVVMYNPNAISGLRILSIPIEDFFYSYSMISFYLSAYLIIREKWQLKAKSV